MAQRMAGKRVALAGPRKADEMAMLVAKMGGEPVQRPAQGTVFLDDIELRNAVVSWVKRYAGLEHFYDRYGAGRAVRYGGGYGRGGTDYGAAARLKYCGAGLQDGQWTQKAWLHARCTRRGWKLDRVNACFCAV